MSTDPRDPAVLRHGLRNALTVAQAAIMRLKLPQSAAILNDLIEVAEREMRGANPHQKFDVGDFVLVNEGMGNCEFGTVMGLSADQNYGANVRYNVVSYDYSGRSLPHPMHPYQNDMQSSTPAEADDYFDQMTMIKMKLWISPGAAR
jgi:hypothetical protein